MKITARILTAAVALGTAASLSAASIGVSFNSNRENTQMTATTVAGVVPSTGWVSSDGGAGAGDGANGGINNGGVGVDWTSNGTWNTNNGISNGDNMVMNGYIDAIGGAGSVDIALSSLSDVFQDGYDIYVYFGSDGNGRTGQIALAGGDTFGYTTFSAHGGDFPNQYLQTTDTGGGNPNANYALFSGLSGDTQAIQVIRGSSNSGVQGIQIVGDLVPEPSLPMLLGFSGLFVLFRRRR